MSANLDLVKTMFSLVDVSGDNFNDMRVMLSCITTQSELRTLWDSFNEKKYFKNLSENEKDIIILTKNELKRKLKF
jgi:hypothetical protein